MLQKAKALLIKKLAIIALVAMMSVTTVVSFAYWISGIHGNQANTPLTVQIGSGTAVTTVVNLQDITNTSGGKKLIPKSREIKNASEETHSVTFTINVVWKGTAADSGANTDNYVNGAPGTLTVENTRIVVNGTDFTGVAGYNLLPLFEVDISYNPVITGSPFTGGPDTPTLVTITISLNEPKDRDQYLQIEGKGAAFTFNFLVESAYDTMIADS